MTSFVCDEARRLPWPSELGFTRVTAHLRVAYADTPCDEDEEPDALAPEGDVVLTWNAPWFRYRPSDGGPVQGWGARSVACKILPDGTIAPPESEVTSGGSVIVLPTVHELLEPSGSTITATIRLTTPGPKFAPISFQARPGATVNILAEADMGKQPGVVVKPVVTEDFAVRAEAAAVRAEAAASSAEAGLVDLSDRVEWIEQNGEEQYGPIGLREPGDTYDIPSGWMVAALRAGYDGAVLDTVYGERVLGPSQWAWQTEWAGDLHRLTGTLTLVSGSIEYAEAGYFDRLYTPFDHLIESNPHPEYAKAEDLPPTRIGPGRPDLPGTTNWLVDGRETGGTTYTSTDGAGVGAWVWRKRPTGWTVVDGDTGWRDVTSIVGAPPELTVWLRRIGYSVRMIASASAEASSEVVVASIPDGYKPSKPGGKPFITAGPIGPVGRASGHGGWIGFNEPHSEGVHSSAKILANNRAYGEWLTDDPWPTALPGTPA